MLQHWDNFRTQIPDYATEYNINVSETTIENLDGASTLLLDAIGICWYSGQMTLVDFGVLELYDPANSMKFFLLFLPVNVIILLSHAISVWVILKQEPGWHNK